MSEAWLGIGSNVEAETHVRVAIEALKAEFAAVELSPVYRSQAVGFKGDDFINLVAKIDTDLSPRQLQQWLRALEDRHGRKRNVPKFSDRVLDVDILLFDQLCLNEQGLVLPRPEILEFAHVLRPLAELSPHLIYPGSSATLGSLWAESGLHATTLEPVEITAC